MVVIVAVVLIVVVVIDVAVVVIVPLLGYFVLLASVFSPSERSFSRVVLHLFKIRSSNLYWFEIVVLHKFY